MTTFPVPASRGALLLARAPLLSLSLLLLPRPAAAATGCENLLAEALATDSGMADCTLAFAVQPAACAARGANTANACAEALAEDPFPLVIPGGMSYDLAGEYAWLCPNSEDGCAVEDWARCADGSRPSFYYDPANDPSSDKWLFYWSGGGGCAGEGCYAHYASNADREMSTCLPSDGCITNQRATMAPAESSAGILLDSANNPFGDYHRIRIRKCTYDGHRGDAIETGLVNPGGDSVDEIYHQGYRSMLYMFNQLAAGAVADLPALSDASHVVLIGNSGGGKGLAHTGDRLRDHIEGLLSDDAYIRLVVDGHHLPMLEYEEYQNGPFAPPDSLFDVGWGGSGFLPPGELGGVAAYDDAVYSAGGRAYDFDQAWGAPLDASCETVHGLDAPECHDEMHVLLNHVSTPFFISMDMRDIVWKEGQAIFSPVTGYNWVDIEFHDRIQAQLQHFAQRYTTDSELALGIDASPVGYANDLWPNQWLQGIWGPSCGGGGSHTPLVKSNHYERVEMETCIGCTQTVGQAMHDWVELGTGIAAIDGFNSWSTLVGAPGPC